MDKSEVEIGDFLLDAPDKYKVYKIPKRKFGHRVIAQPTKELKIYQRTFISLQSFSVHDSAMAYKKSISIKENALRHSSQSYLLKLDLKNFFNSITPDILWDVWGLLGNVPDSIERKWIENLLFWNSDKGLVLSVGAPSSPLISNFVMYAFDVVLSLHCKKQNIIYTRYADDLTFSTNKKDGLFEIPAKVQDLLKESFAGKLNVNHSKTSFSSKAHNRHVTGITITNDGHISLGRARKRYIKHLVHEFILDKLDVQEIRHLQGLLSLSKHIEPSFIDSLKIKHSVYLIDGIFKAKPF